LIIAYIAGICVPLGLAIVFGEKSDDPLLQKAGLRIAVAGFAILILQVILTARFKFLDHVFGIDKVSQFHKAMGITAGVFLLSHPILMAIASKSFGLFAIDTPWVVNLGKLALLFAIVTVLFALMFGRFGVDYNVWRFCHKAAVFIVIFGFAHSYLIGPDLEPAGMKILWWAMLLLAGSIYTYRNFYIPLWGRRLFEVIEVKPQTHDTFTLTFKSKDGLPLARNPGQFMFLKLKRPGRSSEIHPFTISASSLRPDIIEATIKKSGNFTNSIDQTRPGDIGLIEAPFGRFSLVNFDIDKFLFIAGGVGITPIMSMLRYLRETNNKRPVVLLYGNKTEKDIIFRDELEKLPANMKVVNVLSKPQGNWQGPKGYIDMEIIKQYTGEILSQADIFVCGPVAMMDMVISCLKDAGIPSERIHSERFTV
jgi:predicted ferric reductase